MKPEYWTLLNAITSALIGAITAVITLYVQGRRKRKERQREEYDTYKKYSKPIMLAAETLAWRLLEVLTFKGAYLLPDAPMNGFFKYKFDSTIYRLGSLIAWIRAAQKEYSYIEGYNNADNRGLRDSIGSFQKVLADGGHVEVSIFEELCKLYGLRPKQISDPDRQEIGVEIERIVFQYIPDQVKKNVTNLDHTKKLSMISSIMELIATKISQPKLEQVQIEDKLQVAVDEIAREFCWIYRDWQNAIGDEMLVRLTTSYRHFDVIGFSEFMIRREKSEWLKKMDNLFSNLDVSIDTRFDTRVRQVKLIFVSVVNLIEEFNKAIKNDEAISEKDLKTFTKLRQRLESELQ